MARPDISSCALLALAMSVVSCVPPPAKVIGPPLEVKKVEKKPVEQEVVLAEPPVPELPDDGNGIRMPNFLELPGDGEFRANSPSGTRTGQGSGAVVSRPPTDPPSRVKPKPAEKE